MNERYLLIGGPEDGRALVLPKGLDLVRVPVRSALPPLALNRQTIDVPGLEGVQVAEYQRGADGRFHWRG